MQARQRVQRVCGRGGVCECWEALAGQGRGSARLPTLVPGRWCNSGVSLPLWLLGRDLAGCTQAPVSGAPHVALLMAWRLRPERSPGDWGLLKTWACQLHWGWSRKSRGARTFGATRVSLEKLPSISSPHA